MYSASVVESALRLCFFDFHSIAPSADMTAMPVVDFFSSVFANPASVYAISGLLCLSDLQ